MISIIGLAMAQFAQARAYRQGVEAARGQEDAIQRSVLLQEIQRLCNQVQEAKDTNEKLNQELQVLKNSNQ